MFFPPVFYVRPYSRDLLYRMFVLAWWLIYSTADRRRLFALIVPVGEYSGEHERSQIDAQRQRVDTPSAKGRIVREEHPCHVQ